MMHKKTGNREYRGIGWPEWAEKKRKKRKEKKSGGRLGPPLTVRVCVFDIIIQKLR